MGYLYCLGLENNGLHVICVALEKAINIISGQWVLLVLKAGYFTNTTYGYIKWTKYMKSHGKNNENLLTKIPTSNEAKL